MWPGFGAALGVVLGHPAAGGGFSAAELRHGHGQLEKHALLWPKHHLHWSKGSSKEKQQHLPPMFSLGLEAPNHNQAEPFGWGSALHLVTRGLEPLFTLKY